MYHRWYQNALPTDLLRAGSVCGLGIDRCGIRSLASLVFRTAATSGTLVLAKSRAARDYDGASICATTPGMGRIVSENINGV